MPETRRARTRVRRAPTYASRVKSDAPLTMRAAVIDGYGGADRLDVREILVRPPGAREVLIRVDTAGVGSWDMEMRKGNVKTEHGFPLVLGTDGSGTIVAVGSGVTRFKRGDRVWAYVFDNKGGGFNAEYVTVAASAVGHVPEELSLRGAGALAVIGLTALQGVDDALELEKDESVVIHGASGNVGMIAVQLAQWRGARVLASASGADGVELVRGLGVQDVIDGTKDDVARAARDFAPDGLDAVLAFAGGDELLALIDALKKGGRVAHPNGVEPAPRKRRSLRLKSYDAEASPEAFAALNRAVVRTGLQVPIAKSFPLDQIADAHRLMEQDHLLGKVIVTP